MHALLWNKPIHQQPTKLSKCNPHIGSSLSQILCPSHTSRCNLFPMYMSHHSQHSLGWSWVQITWSLGNKSFQGNPFAKEVVMVETNGWLTQNFILFKDGVTNLPTLKWNPEAYIVSEIAMSGGGKWESQISLGQWTLFAPYDVIIILVWEPLT
jgi:hypothetical protein